MSAGFEPLAPGSVIDDRWHVDSILRRDNKATLVSATDTLAERPVLVKVLAQAADSTTRGRFEREIRTIGGLRDQHTVRMFDHGIMQDGRPFLVFERVGGQDLAAVLAQRGALELHVATHIVRQVLTSLREAHHSGLIHRDVQPRNVQVFEYMGDPWSVKLFDFGLARAADVTTEPALTAAGSAVGSTRYAAPEQLLGDGALAASDIYSAGVMFYEMLVGPQAMHTESWSDQLERATTSELQSRVSRSGISPSVAALIHGWLSVEPGRRPSNADVAIAALDAATGREQSSGALQRSRTTSSVAQQPRPTGHQPGVPAGPYGPSTTETLASAAAAATSADKRIIIALGLMILLAVSAIFAIVMSDSPADPPTPRAPVADRMAPAATNIRKTPSPVPPDSSTPDDAGHQLVDVAIEPMDGCGNAPPFRGFDVLVDESDLDVSSFPTFIPKKYDPSKRHVLVVAIRGDFQSPKMLPLRSGFTTIADREQFVIIAPPLESGEGAVNIFGLPGANEGGMVGRNRYFVDEVKAAVDATAAQLCIDRDRVYVLSHRHGSILGGRLMCEDWVKGGANFAYLPSGPFPCEDGAKPVPMWLGFPTKSNSEPYVGGQECMSEAVKISAAKLEKMWADRNQCKGQPKRFFKHGKSYCQRWSCSEAALVSCTLDGGHVWPGLPTPSHEEFANCPGPPLKFPLAEQIWKFFAGLK